MQHHPSETEGSVFAESFQPEPHGKIAGLGEPCFHSAFTHSFSHKGMLSAWKVLNWIFSDEEKSDPFQLYDEL